MTEIRTVPHNLEAEQSVLGGILLDKDGLVKIGDIIHPDDFYDIRHKTIYQHMAGLFERNIPIDVITITNSLDSENKLAYVGGSAYLAQLANSVPVTANLLHYAQIVRKKGTLRRLLKNATDITQLAFESDREIEHILDTAEQKIFEVSQQHLKQNFIPISDIIHESYERIHLLRQNSGEVRGVRTGFLDLDKKLGGLQNSDLIILAARPSMGKTSLALGMIRHAAVSYGVPVGVFSLEMSKEQLVDRLLSAQSGIDLWKIRTGNGLSDDEVGQISQAMGILGDAPIFIDDTAGISIMEIRTKARRLKMEHDIGFIVIDYLQLITGRGGDNRVQEVSEISRNLKILARELNVPVVALSQLSRGVENRPDKVPQLADLRESGSIEQDADVVLFIYREDMYRSNQETPSNIAQIHIKKHRNGATGQIDLRWNSQEASFENLSQNMDISLQEILQNNQKPF